VLANVEKKISSYCHFTKYKVNKAETKLSDRNLSSFNEKFFLSETHPFTIFILESFVKRTMSLSQRQAVITLIEKKDQDRCDLKNWRPISLLNVDAKIASKSYR